MRPLRLIPEAGADVQSAFDYYEDAKEGLGIKFVMQVDETLHAIQHNPEMPQQIASNLRHMRVKKFDAYAVWYTCASEIVILGCIHGRRNIPNVIRQRLKALQP